MTSPGKPATPTIDWNAQFNRLISLNGRVNRTTYAAVWVTSIVVGLLLWSISFPLYALFSLAILWPGITTGVKRLHDQGLTGWVMLIVLVPFVGGLAFLILCLARPSVVGENVYGPQPGPGFNL